MNMKKILSVILCAAVILAIAPSVSAETVSQGADVPEFVRVIDGLLESLLWKIRSNSTAMNYDEYEALCAVPELDKGYVPQGFCYLDERNEYAMSAYSSESASIVAFVDARTGARIKTVYLQNEDGTMSKAHAGGIADIGDSVLVTVGSTIKRLKLDDVDACSDYGTVSFCGSFETDLNCSYACSYENTLFVGEFYIHTFEDTYTSKPEHRNYVSLFERSYTLCEVFDLTDMDSAFENGTVPVRAIAMPNSAQGIAYDGETLAVSISYGRNNDSYLRYYNLPQTADSTITVNSQSVPVTYLSRSQIDKTVTLPPLLEGIDTAQDGAIIGVFESGAQKYSDSKIVLSDFCKF